MGNLRIPIKNLRKPWPIRDILAKLRSEQTWPLILKEILRKVIRKLEIIHGMPRNSEGKPLET
jgi:hypothetical protein